MIQSWFDDYMPKSVQEEIDAITKNPLYQLQATDDDESGPLVGEVDSRLHPRSSMFE